MWVGDDKGWIFALLQKSIERAVLEVSQVN
jgi:hypothetical protein